MLAAPPHGALRRREAQPATTYANFVVSLCMIRSGMVATDVASIHGRFRLHLRKSRHSL